MNAKYYLVIKIIVLCAFYVALSIFFSERRSPEIVFSKESGFYDEDFYLELTSDIRGSKIYYTMDSSEPNEDSFLYTAPIHIYDASLNDNKYSMIEDVALDYNSELLLKGGANQNHGYALPKEKTDKCTVIRAFAIAPNGEKSKIETLIYFVGERVKKKYEGFNIISIVTDPDNLFDYEKGIYVTGKCFVDNNFENGEIIQHDSPLYGGWEANYTQRGEAWEREAEVTIWNVKKGIALNDACGIRIQGGITRGLAKKSLNIFVKNDNGYIDGEELSLDGYKLNSLNLCNCDNASKVKLQDYLVNELCKDLNVSTRESLPCILFLDGEFWGTYWLMPRYEKEYFESKYNLYGNSIIQVKNSKIEMGNNFDLKEYNQMKDYISSIDVSDEENYARVNEILDISSFIDYYAIEIYIVNTDWPDNNVALWKTKNVGNNPMADGRWRWEIFDVNNSMQLPRVDMIRYTACNDSLFASMMESEEFRRVFFERLDYLANYVFNPDIVNPIIDDYEERMADVMVDEYSRFYNNKYSLQDFYNQCESIRGFLEERYDYINNFDREIYLNTK